MSFEPYKGEVNLRIYQKEYDGEFSHWEWELSIGGEIISEGTSPEFWGCWDTDVFYSDHGYEPEEVIDMEYFRMDANKRNYE